MKKIYILVGTRPNFIKVTQFKKEALNFPEMEISIIHTGQHYDHKMADVFFEQFKLEPDHFLDIKPAHPVLQVAEIMIRLKELCDKIGDPDFLLVPGDVNSTLAGAHFEQKPCLTLRKNTKKPTTINEGSNTLVSFEVNEIKHYIDLIMQGNYKKGEIPELWDGKATKRILSAINEKNFNR